LRKVSETFGDIDPSAITVTDIAEWVAKLADSHKPGTVRLYLRTLKMLFDFVGLDPNPARDPRVRAPKVVQEEPQPPTAEHFLAIIDAVRDPVRRLLFVTIEQGALRLGEAVTLRWGDVDRAGLRLRLPRSATKRDKARWVYLPEWLIEAIERTCPFDDRTPDRRVFQGVTESAAWATMARACQNAGVPHYSPHGLRHRRITMWHQSGVVARELAERAGHSRASMTLDVYAHVMPLDEVPEAELRDRVAL
jgi:integrase